MQKKLKRISALGVGVRSHALLGVNYHKADAAPKPAAPTTKGPLALWRVPMQAAPKPKTPARKPESHT